MRPSTPNTPRAAARAAAQGLRRWGGRLTTLAAAALLLPAASMAAGAVGPARVVVARSLARTGTSIVLARAAAGADGRTARSSQRDANPPLPDCLVPDLRGKTVLQLEYHGVLAGRRDGNPTHYCRLGQVTTRGASLVTRQRPLVIISQNPQAGARVAYFTPISVVVAAAGAARRAGPCHLVAGEEAVARFPNLLVYRSYADGVTGSGSQFAQASWHTCRRPRGTRSIIYVSSNVDGLDDKVAGPFAAGGRYLAYTIDAFESKYNSARYLRIVVRDLERGADVFSYEIGHSFPDTPPVPDVIAIVVSAQGFAAWLTQEASGTHVFARDSRGTRLLDQAAGHAITHLRFRADKLTWTKSGEPQTATLA